MPAGAIIGAAANIVGSLFGASKAKSAARRAARERARLQKRLQGLENSRQAIINPYGGVKDLSSLAVDLSSQISNPFSNLGVATKAAEMEIEQADISLANTLDTLMASGAGAGGATALAQAALKSKQGVSASIEQQEAQNEKLRAEGEQAMQKAKLEEQVRIQDVQLGEGARVQGLKGQGESIRLQMQENREQDQIDYVRGQLEAARQDQAKAQADATSATMGAIGGLGRLAAGSGLFGGDS
jgi:hypothetical protein